jgi:hypothetical protein
MHMPDPQKLHARNSRESSRLSAILILTGFFCLGGDVVRSGRCLVFETVESFGAEAGNRSEAPLLSQDIFDGLPEMVTDMAVDTLAEAIESSRERAWATAKPIPERIKRALLPYVDPAILEKVRYTTDWGASERLTLHRLIMANGNVQAVTLNDIIVFREKRGVEDVFLWSHELKHVEQYDRWGVRRFSANYLMDYQRVELEADDHAVSIYRKLLQKHYNLPPSERPRLP